MQINNNGNLVALESLGVGVHNRGFQYGDALFDTLKCKGGEIAYLEDHYFRLMSSMRMLRMRIPMDMTMEFYREEILKTVRANELSDLARIRVDVFRMEGGLYSPDSSEVEFLITAKPIDKKEHDSYEVELYKDFNLCSGLLSTVKTNNRMLNVLAGIFAQENSYQNCLLINEKKELVEAINSNVFLVFGNEVVTPSMESGCVNGIIRKNLIRKLEAREEFEIVERSVNPFELLKADEVFLTNSITNIISVNKYRKKTFQTTRTEEIRGIFKS
jgi:branched-chain amino acid aminotransferase